MPNDNCEVCGAECNRWCGICDKCHDAQLAPTLVCECCHGPMSSVEKNLYDGICYRCNNGETEASRVGWEGNTYCPA